jgi:hypothetical protein
MFLKSYVPNQDLKKTHIYSYLQEHCKFFGCHISKLNNALLILSCSHSNVQNENF